ncbi:MAG: cobalamin-dependent protein [Christensenella sp.]|uniref:cobalamin-dependent protein n=1 Tax=Christensenella sp. TaxID=1935934 RepID=UPI002B21FA18|nr:cobalamin-dependent protein [Christensenella sp.]MEA5002516.1 cobalamin-dependent protein [Christensenella sp.]
MPRKIRVLIGKVGCDIHERGALTLINVLRNAGMEVIYTGRYQSEENIVKAAIAEDVDVITISDLTGGLVVISKKIMEAMAQLEVDIPVMCGGLMTEEDKTQMATMGIRACMGTDSAVDDCVAKVFEVVGVQPEDY